MSKKTLLIIVAAITVGLVLVGYFVLRNNFKNSEKSESKTCVTDADCGPNEYCGIGVGNPPLGMAVPRNCLPVGFHPY